MIEKPGAKPAAAAWRRRILFPTEETCLPQAGNVVWEKVGHAIEHFARSFVREREEENIRWRDAVLQQVGDAINQRPRFAAARTRNDERRTGRRHDRGTLLRIELPGKIDARFRTGGRPLECVLAGQWRRECRVTSPGWPVESNSNRLPCADAHS